MLGSIATGVVGQALLVVSGIVVARSLGPDSRGVLGLLFIVSALAAQIGSLGVPTAVTYWVAALSVEPGSVLAALHWFRRIQLALVLLAQIVLIFVVLEPKSPPGFMWVGMLSLTATAAALSQMYGLAVLQALERFRAFNVLRTLYGVLYTLGAVALWQLDRATLTWLALAIVAAFVGSAFTTWLVVRRYLSASQVRDIHGRNADVLSTSPIVRFGIKSLFGSSPPMETFRLDQLLVGVVLPPAVLGYYIVALAFTNLTRFVGQSIGMVTYPKVAGASAAERLKIVRRDFGLGATICGSLTVGLVVSVPVLLPHLFGASFEPSVAASQILLVGTLCSALRRILIDGTRGAGWPLWGAIAEGITLLALPAVVVVAEVTASLEAVAAAIAAANLLGLAILAPALTSAPYRRGVDSATRGADHVLEDDNDGALDYQLTAGNPS